MTTPEERDRELQLRQAELEARERELKLRELETEIYQEQRAQEAEINAPEPPLYRTQKHEPTSSSIQNFGRKIVKFAKFSAFVVCGIAFIRVGFLVGMWITYAGLAAVIAAVGYQIFLRE